MTIKEEVPLAPYTTFKVGGPARYFAEVKNEDELKESITFAREKGVPFFILGGGSNILVSDKGFPGLVIKISLLGMEHEEIPGRVLVKVSAGENWDDFVAYAVARSWYGIENLSGIPGTVGAAPVQNIGAYGVQIDEIIDSVVAFNTGIGETKTFSNKDCCFGYRDSFFKTKEGKKYVITKVTFVLSLAPLADLTASYKDNRFDIGELVKKKSANPTLKDVRETILEVREKKGMVIKREGESYASAGSFFGGLIVRRESFEHILKIARRINGVKEDYLRPWFWETKNGQVKIAPAFFLEYTPFNKGYSRGRVGVSPKHSLAIINRNGATAREIYNLANDMREAVKETFDVSLNPEVEYVGEF